MKEICYRIEDESGNGPYSVCKEWIDKDHDQRNPETLRKELAEIKKNLKNKNKYRMVYGFSNLEQFKSWFSESEIEKLVNLGFFLRKSLGKVFHKDEKQIIFIQDLRFNSEIIDI